MSSLIILVFRPTNYSTTNTWEKHDLVKNAADLPQAPAVNSDVSFVSFDYTEMPPRSVYTGANLLRPAPLFWGLL